MDYKKYSLDKLKEWLHDALGPGEASPQEIYDTIKEVVQEEYYYYKNGASKTNELLTLLNGHSVPDMTSEKVPVGMGATEGDYITFNFTYNEPYTCGVGNSGDYCNNAWNSFWEENTPEEYYKNVSPSATQRDLDKVKRWQLPVEVDAANDEYFVCFPDDLLEAANLKEGDAVEWVDNGDGSYLLKKTDKTTENR